MRGNTSTRRAELLVFADALCQFNPAYGQGMTVAACEAMVLRRCLEQGRAQLAPRFFTAAGKVIDVPWDIAVGADLAFPWVEGPRTARGKFIGRYLARVHAAAE